MHVMQGKNYLYGELRKIAPLGLTTGGDISNRRLDWGIEKTRSNDACCITGLQVDSLGVLPYEYTIRLRRRRIQTTQDTRNLIIKHGDLVRYKPRNRNSVTCYVIAVLELGTCKGKYKLKGVETGE